MKSLKQYFKMIVTAVICFAMSFLPGRKKGTDTEKVLAMAKGQASLKRNKKNRFHTGTTVYVSGIQQNTPVSSRIIHRNILLKKVFERIQGPGDKSPLNYESSG